MNIHYSYIPKDHIRSYLFGFNGMQKDDEVYGSGNSYTAEFWQYDPRIGRRWNVDPMSAKYPGQSPYVAFNNCPIYFKDPAGLEGQGENPPSASSKLKRSLDKKVSSSSGLNQAVNNIGNRTKSHKLDNVSSASDKINKEDKIIAEASSSTSGINAGDMSQKSKDEFEAQKREAANYVYMHNEFGDAYVWEDKDEIAKNRINDIGLAFMFSGGGVLSTPTAAIEGAGVGAGTKAPFVAETIENFYVSSSTTFSGGVFTKTVETLASMKEGTSVVRLLNAFETQAKTAGANKIVINGIRIVNEKLFNASTAQKFGYTFEKTSEDAIQITKILN